MERTKGTMAQATENRAVMRILGFPDELDLVSCGVVAGLELIEELLSLRGDFVVEHTT